MDLDRIIADLEELSEMLLDDNVINPGQSYALGFAIGMVEALREKIEK